MSAAATLPQPPPPVSDSPAAQAPRKPERTASQILLSTIDVEAAPTDDERPLATRDIALGVAGYLALPAVGLLDVGGMGVLPTAIAPPVAALFLSVPSLLVGHQFLGLHADPRDLMADVGRVFVLGGRLALGVVPAVGLYAATTGLGPVALMVALAIIGIGSVELARRRLLRREARMKVDCTVAPHERRARMTLLATAWSALSLLIAIRLGITLLSSI